MSFILNSKQISSDDPAIFIVDLIEIKGGDPNAFYSKQIKGRDLDEQLYDHHSSPVGFSGSSFTSLSYLPFSKFARSSIDNV